MAHPTPLVARRYAGRTPREHHGIPRPDGTFTQFAVRPAVAAGRHR